MFPRDTDPIQIYAVGAKRTLDPIACVIKINQTLILDPHPHARPWLYEPPSAVGPAGERPRPACPFARRRLPNSPAIPRSRAPKSALSGNGVSDRVDFCGRRN